MKKQLAIALRAKANEIAEAFSSTDRARNYDNETFSVNCIKILSEATAAVVFDKHPTGKQAVAFLYYVNGGQQPSWRYFFATYQHLTGLEFLKNILYVVEQHNFAVGERA